MCLLLALLPSIALAQQMTDRAALTALAAQRFSDADALGAVRLTIGAEAPQVLLDSGFGQAAGRRVTERTRFALGSLSELGTLAALLELADYGIDLDSTLGTSLGDQLPAAFHKTSLRMLAEHRSGLPDDVRLGDDEARDVAFFLERVGRSGMRAAPGHPPRPNNRLDYRVLAAAISQVAEMPFDDVLRESILPRRGTDPTWTTAEVSARRADELAAVASRTRTIANGALETERNWRHRGRSDWIASSRGLHEWFAAHLLPGTEETPSLGDRLRTSQSKFALGFTIGRNRKGEVEWVRRTATTGPTRAWVEWWPKQHAVLVMLGTESMPTRLADELTARIPAAAEAASLGSADRFAGRYRLDKHNRFAVDVEGDVVRLVGLGPAAAARVLHGQPTMPEWPTVHRDFAARAALIGRSLIRGNTKGLQRHFHAEADPHAGDRAAAMIAAVTEEHGAVKGGCKVLGYSPHPVPRSIVSARFGRREVRFGLIWHGEQIRQVTLESGELPFGVVLVATDIPNTYRARSIDRRKEVRVEFLGSPDQPAAALRWFDQGKRGRKGIRCVRVKRR